MLTGLDWFYCLLPKLGASKGCLGGTIVFEKLLESTLYSYKYMQLIFAKIQRRMNKEKKTTTDYVAVLKILKNPLKSKEHKLMFKLDYGLKVAV